MKNKAIIGLIIFVIVAVLAAAGAFAYTKVFNSPKRIFAKNLKEIVEQTSVYQPAKLKGVYEASKSGPIEYDVTVEAESGSSTDEDETEGDTNPLETSLTLSMNEDEEETSDQEQEQEQEDEDYSTDESDYENSDEESNEDENEQTSEEDDFLSNYTWSSASGQDAVEAPSSDSDESVKIKVNTKTTIDTPNKAGNVSLDVKVSSDGIGGTFLKGNINYKDRIFSAFLEGLHEKNIAVENKDLKGMLKNFGLEDDDLKYVPDSIEAIEMSEEEEKAFKEKSIEFIKTTLNEFDDTAYTASKFSESYGKYITDTQEGKVTTLKVPLKVLETKVMAFVKEIASDETTLPSIKKTLTPDAKKELLKTIDDAQKDVELIDESNMAEISLYVSKSGAYKVRFKYDNTDTVEINESMDYKNDKVELSVKRTLKDDSSKIVLPGSTTYSYVDLGNENKYITETEYNEADLNRMVDEYNSDINTSDDEEDESFSSYSFNEKKTLKDYKETYPSTTSVMEFSFDNSSDSLLAGTCKLSGTKNGKKDSSYNSIKSVKFDIKKSDGKNIQKATDENALIINNYTEEDFEDMKVEMLSNIEKYAQSNKLSWASFASSYIQLFSMSSNSDDSNYQDLYGDDYNSYSFDDEEDEENENEETDEYNYDEEDESNEEN